MGKKGDKKEKPRPDSLFSQQRLPTWEPIINFGTTWIIFLGFGLLITAIGVALVIVLLANSEEIQVHYAGGEGATCKNAQGQQKSCKQCAKIKENQTSECEVTFTVTEDQKLKVPVFMYYQLTEFYQNHRSYVSNRDDVQLYGAKVFKEDQSSINDLSEDGCKNPFRKDPSGKYYFPCGAGANAMFSDKFRNLTHTKENASTHIELNDHHSVITWAVEKEYKYKNPPGISKMSPSVTASETPARTVFLKHFAKPRDWTDKVVDDFWAGGGVGNPHFINWMHQAPMANFRKLYAMIDTGKGCGENQDYLCAGEYTLHVENNFQPKGWVGGSKTIIFATTSFFGTRKPFMAWVTLLFGIFCIIVGIVFFILKKTLKERVHPHRQKSNPQEILAVEENPEDEDVAEKESSPGPEVATDDNSHAHPHPVKKKSHPKAHPHPHGNAHPHPQHPPAHPHKKVKGDKTAHATPTATDPQNVNADNAAVAESHSADSKKDSKGSKGSKESTHSNNSAHLKTEKKLHPRPHHTAGAAGAKGGPNHTKKVKKVKSKQVP